MKTGVFDCPGIDFIFDFSVLLVSLPIDWQWIGNELAALAMDWQCRAMSLRLENDMLFNVPFPLFVPLLLFALGVAVERQVAPRLFLLEHVRWFWPFEFRADQGGG